MFKKKSKYWVSISSFNSTYMILLSHIRSLASYHCQDHYEGSEKCTLLKITAKLDNKSSSSLK